MKQNKFFTALILFVLMGVSAMAGKAKFVTVEINYGEQKAAETIQVECFDSMTALEALMHAADIKTHPVGQHVFVTSIGGVEGVRGDKAWYYKINGEGSKKLAISQPVKAGDTISWRYVKDVCSCTVDGPKKK